MRVGILTISDRCSRGEAEDKSGPGLVQMAQNLSWNVATTAIVPDEKIMIENVLKGWSDDLKLALILTTGGTGFSPRDVTPEATKNVIEKEAPGLAHAMMAGSLAVTPMAMLSRSTAGIRGTTLIVNFPGSKKASAECFQFVMPALKHGLEVLHDDKAKVEDQHGRIQGRKNHVCPHADVDLTTDVAGRPRSSPYPMISVSEAQSIVLSFVDPDREIQTEKVGFRQALGRVLARDVVARDNLPPFPASIKDGYAVLASDGIGRRLVTGASNAGNGPDISLKSGTCFRINTGAPVPNGADCVVQVEDTKLVRKSEDGTEEVEIEILPVAEANLRQGHDIRPIGSDIEVDTVILAKGSHVRPAEIGLLAAVGATEVEVYRRPVVALLSTGNELAEPGQKLAPGFIRDSNKSTLWSLIECEHGYPTYDCGIASDNLGELKAKLEEAFNNAEVVVTTGGVSMGDRDLLRQVLISDFGADVKFARVKMKPGKPTTCATLKWNGREKILLGLPGNPVSATVTCHLYVLPLCRKLSGHTRPMPALLKAKLSDDVKLDPRPEYQRVFLSWNGNDPIANVESTGNQISSRLASLKAANGLLILPPKEDSRPILRAGEVVNAMIIGPLVQ